jgi:hypothetical protein
VRWEHVGLATQVGLLGFSFYLSHVAHKGLHDAWHPGALPERRKIRSRRTCDALEPSQWVQSLGACGNVGTHLGWEVGHGAVGHVAAPEPTLPRRQDQELQITCLDL